MTRQDENRILARVIASTPRTERREDRAPYLAIVALMFSLACMIAVGVTGWG